jgi:hypothetical protein
MFCWQCGATLMERSPGAPGPASSALAGERAGSTAVMEALLAPGGAAPGDAGAPRSRLNRSRDE